MTGIVILFRLPFTSEIDLKKQTKMNFTVTQIYQDKFLN